MNKIVILILFVFISLIHINGQLIQLVVNPNGNTSFASECGTESSPTCNTIKDAYNYYRYNTSYNSLDLLLMPGVYSLKLNSLSLNMAKIRFLSNSPGGVIFDGGDDGSSNSQPFFDIQNNSEVLFQDIVFNNFTYRQFVIISYNSRDLTFNGCVFRDCDTTISTIRFEESAVQIIDSTLEQTLGNKADRNQNFIHAGSNSNIIIKGMFANSIIGLFSFIKVSNSVVDIEGSQFNDITTTNGIISIGDSKLNLVNSIFEGNKLIVEKDGNNAPVLTIFSTEFNISACQFKNNEALLKSDNLFYDASGVIEINAISTFNGKCSIKGSSFEKNVGFRGGVIGINNVNLEIHDSTFQLNRIHKTIGGVGSIYYVDGISNLTTVASEIYNDDKDGLPNGTFYATTVSHVNFTSCNFQDSPISTYCTAFSTFHFETCINLNSSFLCKSCNKITIDKNNADKCDGVSDSDSDGGESKPSKGNTLSINYIIINLLIIIVLFWTAN